ncbi:MAG: hypothetical protein AAGA68_19810 [Pseudomonadota bacterium]
MSPGRERDGAITDGIAQAITNLEATDIATSMEVALKANGAVHDATRGDIYVTTSSEARMPNGSSLLT